MAKVTRNLTADLFGMLVSGTTYMEIRNASEAGMCSLYSMTVDSSVKLSDAIVASALAKGISMDDIRKQEEVSNQQAKASIGLNGTCKYGVSELSAVLNKWNAGHFASSDYASAECSGKLFEGVNSNGGSANLTLKNTTLTNINKDYNYVMANYKSMEKPSDMLAMMGDVNALLLSKNTTFDQKKALQSIFADLFERRKNIIASQANASNSFNTAFDTEYSYLVNNWRAANNSYVISDMINRTVSLLRKGNLTASQEYMLQLINASLSAHLSTKPDPVSPPPATTPPNANTTTVKTTPKANISSPNITFTYSTRYTTYFPEHLVWFCDDRGTEFYRMHWTGYFGGDCSAPKPIEGFVNFSDYAATGCTQIPCCLNGPYNEYSRSYDYFECGFN